MKKTFIYPELASFLCNFEANSSKQGQVIAHELQMSHTYWINLKGGNQKLSPKRYDQFSKYFSVPKETIAEYAKGIEKEPRSQDSTIIEKSDETDAQPRTDRERWLIERTRRIEIQKTVPELLNKFEVEISKQLNLFTIGLREDISAGISEGIKAALAKRSHTKIGGP